MKKIILLLLLFLLICSTCYADQTSDLNTALSDIKLDGEIAHDTNYLFLSEKVNNSLSFYKGFVGNLKVGLLTFDNKVCAAVIQADNSFSPYWSSIVFEHLGKPDKDISDDSKQRLKTECLVLTKNNYDFQYIFSACEKFYTSYNKQLILPKTYLYFESNHYNTDPPNYRMVYLISKGFIL